MDAIFGPVLYRLLIRQVPLEEKDIHNIVDRALGYIPGRQPTSKP
jgi:hypothetical protein